MLLLEQYLKVNAQKYPGQLAVIHEAEQLSYGELEFCSTVLAEQLLAQGIRPGDRVALALENSCAYLAAYFAVLKVQAVLVPLNIQLVEREILYLLNDCSPKAMLCDRRRAQALQRFFSARPAEGQAPTPPAVLEVKLPELKQGTLQGLALPPPALPEQLACLIYTSGTTGKSKGVMLSQENLVANALSIIEYLELTSRDRVMVVLPFYYSYGNSLLTTHIMAGGTLVIDNRFAYPNTVLEAMEKQQVTGFAGVPSTFSILLRKAALSQYKLPSLRYVTQAGGAMSPPMIQEFITAVPQAKFFVMYGQTEATARLSYLPPERLLEKMGAIGIAIPGVELDVVDEDGMPVALGNTGEIVAQGKNIMLGYWNAPEATQQVLKNGRLFTGDLARKDADGFIFVVGRSREMIKSGANRISPQDIESVVCQVPGVLESAAVGLPDLIMGESIHLFVVTVPGATVTERDILRFCKENLASFKVPSGVTFVSSLPKTASGKIKRLELKQA